MKENSIALLGVKGGPAIRPGSNMPTSMLVQIGGKNILVDAGLGVCRGICDQGIQLKNIDLVLITHLHSDHYLELGPFFHTAWVAGLAKPIRVIGPKGLAHYWKHFVASMEFDVSLRIEDEGRCDFASLFDLQELHEGEVYDQDGVSVTALKNRHPPIDESYALKLSALGKILVLSGDTAFMPEMIEFSKDADLLVHEAMLVDGVNALIERMTNGDDRLREHILRSHTSAEDTGKIAKSANVKALALNHFVPDGDPDFTKKKWEKAVRKNWSGSLYIGQDGMVIEF